MEAVQAQVLSHYRSELVDRIRARGHVLSAGGMTVKLAKEFGIPYEGKIVTSVLYQPDLKSDPIHPNAGGYRKMAEAIADLLRKAKAL